MTVHTYSGSTLTANVTRDTTPAGTFSAMSCNRTFGVPVLFESYVCDIRSAGNYELRIDGVTVASVAGVAAAATDVTFAPSSPIELLPGDGAEADGSYEFSLVCTSGAVTWYGRGNLGTTGNPSGVDGTGRDFQGQDYWHEINTGAGVPGQVNFKTADTALVSTLAVDSLSSGSFSGQTFDVTFDVDVILFSFRKRLFASDTWTLNIDGNPVASAVKDANALTGDFCMGIPDGGLPLAAGTHTINIDPTANRRMYYDSGTGGAPSGTGSSHTTAWSVWAESTGNKVSGTVFFRLALSVPTSFSATTIDADSVDLEWAAPASGPAPAGYEYRVDAGVPVDVGNVLSTVVTGLDPETTYTFEVRAYLDGAYSDWVDATATTDDDATPLPPGVYRIVLDIGPAAENSFDVTLGDDPDYGVLLPLTLGWDYPAGERLLPAQANPAILSFSVLVPDSTDERIDAVLVGAPVRFRMFFGDSDDEWQHFTGNITDVTGKFVRRKRSTGEWDWRVDVFASDVAGLDRPVGIDDEGLAEGDINERLNQLENYLDLLTTDVDDDVTGDPASDDLLGLDNQYVQGREVGQWVSALAHLRGVLAYAVADEGTGTYGRWLFGFDPFDGGQGRIRLRLARQETSFDDNIVLDGASVVVEGAWQRQAANRVPRWGTVDGIRFGTYGYPPEPGLAVSTQYLPDPPAAGADDARTNWANFVLAAADFTQLDGWRTKQLKHLTYLGDFNQLRFMVSEGNGEPLGRRLHPVAIGNLGDELKVDGADWIVGTLAGAQLVIPPRGKFYTLLKLRSELPPGFELPLVVPS